MKLLYKAISKEGKPMRGVLDAKDEKEAVKYLRARGMFPVTLAKKKNINIPFLRKSGATELVFFTRQLSSMIASGLTLMQSLSILQEQVQNPIMQEAINAIVSDIQEGKTFLQQLPNIHLFFLISTYLLLKLLNHLVFWTKCFFVWQTIWKSKKNSKGQLNPLSCIQ